MAKRNDDLTKNVKFDQDCLHRKYAEVKDSLYLRSLQDASHFAPKESDVCIKLKITVLNMVHPKSAAKLLCAPSAGSPAT